MERLDDKSEIRRRLDLDREWALYALADLDPGRFGHCDWWGVDEGLALVFRALAIRPIIVVGDAPTTRRILEGLPERSGYLNLQPHQLEAAEGLYRFRERHEMQRMFVDTLQVPANEAEVLSDVHCEEIETLYATGDGGGIAFSRFQLQGGFFRGIRRDGQLVAVAGIHVVSEAESVAGIGNVFTRPDFRGRGLAQQVTAAVTRALQRAGIRTIGLNVETSNLAGMRAYERIGFRKRFIFHEGPAERVV